MPLSTYADLKKSLLDWSKRKDAQALLADFISMAETKMFSNEAEGLEVRELESRALSTVASRYHALPDDFVSMRRLTIKASGSDVDLYGVAPDQLRIISGSGRPKYFTVTSQLEFDRVPDSAYEIEMQYFSKPPALSSTVSTNVIMSNYPEVYLHGSLWALFTWAMQEDKAEFHYQKFLQAIKGANKQSKRGRYGSAPFMRIEGATP